MNTSSEQFWLNLGAIVVGVCVVLIVILSLLEKRKTGRWPDVITGRKGGGGWFGLVFWTYFVLSGVMSEQTLRRLPLSVLVPGVDVALFLGSLSFAGFVFSWLFKAEWNRQTSLWISWSLLFPALTLTLVVRDFRSLASFSWAWILALLLALFLTPVLARLTYQEFYLKRAKQSS